MKIDSSVFVIITLILLLIVLITTLTTSYDTIIKQQQSQIDSLNHKLFELKVDSVHYKTTEEKIVKPNKEINKQYEKYYNHETK
jgi:predicted PurR-regulated permease PerM